MVSFEMKRISQRVLKESQGGGAKVWAEIIKLSQSNNIVSNLGQGFPDFEGTRQARETAVQLINENVSANQYSPVPGTLRLRQALTRMWNEEASQRPHAVPVDVSKNVIVTSSGTEALYAAMQAIVDPGDEVIMFEPFFPWYVPAVRMAGGIPVCVRLDAPSFEINFERLEASFSEKTKAVIFNTPHNPTGHVASLEEVEKLAKLCMDKNALVVSDEVYDHFLFHDDAGKRHVHHRVAHVKGMSDRTITIGTSSKIFSLTGWRVGWCFGPEDLISAISTCHAYNSYCAPTPLQDGVASALEEMMDQVVESKVLAEIKSLCQQFEENAQLLSAGLESLRVRSYRPDGGYFLVCDVSETGLDDVEFCRRLAIDLGVIAVPMSVFHDPSSGDAPSNLVRLAICKKRETILAAVEALQSGTLVFDQAK